ncbi:pilus assembly protein TadG-related protein [Thiohalocapsa marina]|uniref:pilus assembly protein TadG-related protein n=1 Tax=Thiohalocapsa marina TaxID=424902 RepID=UPI0036DB8CA6
MFVLISVPVFVAVLGIVFDVGLIFRDKNRLRHVAERAALSAASELDRGGSDRADWLRATAVNTVRQAGVQAQQDVTCPKADTDIIVTDSDTNTITECPEGSACVSVGICTTANSYFGWIPGMPELLTARAVAAVDQQASSINACIHALSDDAECALDLQGNAAIVTNGCDIAVNSAHASAAFCVQNTSASAQAIDGGITVVGTADIHRNATVMPAPTSGGSAVADPLSGISCGDTFEDWTVYCQLPGVGAHDENKPISVSGSPDLTLPSGIYFLGNGLVSTGGATLMQGDNGPGIILYSRTGSMEFGGNVTLDFNGAIIADTIALSGTPRAGGYQIGAPGASGPPYLVFSE